MITTGIIKQVNISGEGYTSNLCIVEVSIFNSAADSKDYKADLIATICLPNGINDDYKVGDLVYISFVNNQYKYPVVLGKIYRGIDNEASGAYNITSLKVSDKTELSKDTKIGDITYNDLLQIKSGNISDGTNSEDISDLISEAINLTGQTIDLNNLNFSIGFPNHRRYVCKTSAGSANITNKPIPNYAFVLDVELVRWANSSDYITKQTLWGTDNGDVLWIRTCQNGTWEAWFANPYRKMIPICATSGTTQTKIVNQPNYTLTTGNMISIYFLASNTVANPTLNINGTGAKPIYVNNAPATASNLTAGWHTFYYNGMNYQTGNCFDGLNVSYATGTSQIRQTTNIVAGEAITANRLIYAKDDNKYYVLGASATINTLLPILYTNSAIKSGAAGNNNWTIRNQSAAYMLGNGSVVTLTAYTPVFLKGVLTGHTFTLASSDWWTQTIPTSHDEFQYMLLGYAYSTTFIRLYDNHPIYVYQKGAFQIYTCPERVIATASDIDTVIL